MKEMQEFLKSLGQDYTIDELANLTHLNLRFNNLTSIPDVSKLTKLTHLNLSNNNLTTLPDLSNLTNLMYLNLSDNKLTILPDLSKLTYLISLYLDNNPLIIFEPQLEWLKNIAMLTHLSEFKIIKDNELTRSLFL